MIGTSRRGTSIRITQLLLLASALGLATLAAAALKDKPAKGVTLAGTEWRIDPYRSDDPDTVIQKAHDKENGAGRDRRCTNRGVGGDDGPFGGGSRGGGTWGGGGGSPPGGEERRGGSDDFPGGGGYRRDCDSDSDRTASHRTSTDRTSTSTDIDPTGTSTSASVQIGSLGGGIRNEFVTQLGKNPDTLAFREANQRMTVSEDKVETECAPGEKVPISDSYGDGERNCGWDGRAWVVQTTRGKHFSRTDRYEVSKDGKTLNYITTASGARMPTIKILRVYTLAPPKAAG